MCGIVGLHLKNEAALRDGLGRLVGKPLVVAEHSDYVAVASEYSAMTGLPGIENAAVPEPMPGDVHAWAQA